MINYLNSDVGFPPSAIFIFFFNNDQYKFRPILLVIYKFQEIPNKFSSYPL